MDLKDKDKLKDRLNNQAEKKNLPAVTVKSLLSNEAVKKRFEEILGAKAAGFIASVINVTNTNRELAACDPHSVVAAAATAATLDLPIDPNLGFAAIIPYDGKEGKKAQFQVQWKGFAQLSIRTGLYSTMHVSEVYEDELASYNPLTGDVTFTDPSTWKHRAAGKTDKIIGYYAFFRLANGFSKGLYMTIAELEAHGKRYSKSYNNPKGMWKKDPHFMYRKTVIKLLLKTWGIMSIDIQRAMKADQAVIYNESLDETGAIEYVDGADGDIQAEYSFSEEESRKFDQELAEQEAGGLFEFDREKEK
ncbi:MAG: RecT family protein [Peptococcaceae bacterium]|jgi:recombination protein RecT|nr:RecT family protein [Peptococcaceae bacterium]